MYFSKSILSTVLLTVSLNEVSSYDVPIDKLFSTKTAYYSPDRTETPAPKGCQATQLQGVVRHGARNPGKSDIEKLIMLDDLIEKEKENIEKSEYSWVTAWDNVFIHEEAHLLVGTGEEEQYEIAKRLKKRYPNAFDVPYIATRYQFSETEVSRASHSASAFVYGIFEGQGRLGKSQFQPVDVLSVGKKADRLLRFYDTCPHFEELHDSPGSTTKAQQKKFRKSPMFLELLKDVAKKLNIEKIGHNELHGIYRACSYESVHFKKLSPWCELLGEKALRLLEYHDDLKQWWVKSYGYEINYKIATSLLVDVLQGAVGKTFGSKIKANVRFAHAETVMPLVTLLGLFKDEDTFMANFTYQQILDRKFTSSRVSPFSANVFFVLYECEGEGESYLKLLLNEEEMVIPFCAEHGLYCPISKIQEYIQSLTKDFSFEKTCKMDEPTFSDVLSLFFNVAFSAFD